VLCSSSTERMPGGHKVTSKGESSIDICSVISGVSVVLTCVSLQYSHSILLYSSSQSYLSHRPRCSLLLPHSLPFIDPLISQPLISHSPSYLTPSSLTPASLTPDCVSPAIHSLRADTPISRHIIKATGHANHHVGSWQTNMTSAVATISC
jgi:hypothetical protein